MSRSSSRRKTRYLRLGVRFDAPGVSKELVVKGLLHSIDVGDYWYPPSWRVALGWSNHAEKELKWGEWTKEMAASAESSEGFQYAVQSYLENLL